jgi:D-inositol-3-phosphate glycosyltransferase
MTSFHSAIPSADGRIVRGVIDRPIAGSVIAPRRIEVFGWVEFGGEPPYAVVVSAEGSSASVESPARMFKRPDAAQVLNIPEDVPIGWTARLDMSELAGQEANIFVSTWTRVDDEPERFGPVPVTVRSRDEPLDSRIFGSLDEPQESPQLIDRDMVLIGGWAMTEEGLVDEVEVFLNGTSFGRARIALPRPDIAESHDLAHAVLSGFVLQVDLDRLPETMSKISIKAVARANGRSAILGEAKLSLAPPRRVRLDRPSARERILASRTSALLARVSRRPPPSANRQGPLNLLVVTHDLGYGGGQLWLAELLDKSGAGRDFACTVLAPGSGPLEKEFEKRGIEVRVVQGYRMHDVELYESQVLSIALWSRCLGHNCVLVNTFGAFIGADVAGRLGLPCVWAIHESWPPQEFWKVNFPPGYVVPRIRATAARALATTSSLVFEARATMELFEDMASPGACRVVPYGIDFSLIDSYMAENRPEDAKRRLGFSVRDRVILVLGTIQDRKMQTLIAAAFARIASTYPQTQLVFVGDTGLPYADALRSYVRGVGLESRVRIEKVVKDTFAWYRAADVFVSASDVESLPRTVLEVMAFGVPVAATSVFGIPELIEDGVNGFLFEPRDLAEASRCIERVLATPSERLSRITERANAIVRERHDSRSYSAEILDLIKGLREHRADEPVRPDRALGGSAAPDRGAVSAIR